MRNSNSIISLLTAVAIWITSAGFGNVPKWDSLAPAADLKRPIAMAQAQDFDFSVYLPLVSYTTATDKDLTIRALEPTQAIQTSQNSVPMIANRATVLRVYTTSGSASSATNVRVSVMATRNGASLPGSPLVTNPGTVPVEWSRADIANSFNIRLPTAWLSGRVTLTVRVDSSNAYSEKDESNNTATITLNFETTPTLDVKVVPMNYTGSGSLYPPASTSYLAPSLMKLYPVSQVTVSSRAAIDVTCDFDTDGCWDDVLDWVTALKKTDVAPLTQFYYGVIPIRISTTSNQTWFYGGTAGYGWVGFPLPRYRNDRAAIGLADWTDRGIDGGLIAAHEIGHNLGRQHVPCNTSGAYYPYNVRSIGHFGLDVSAMKVFSPNVYADLMGYCYPQWISDYTYSGLLTGLQTDIGAGSYPPGIAEGLLIRANVTDGQSVDMAPAYAFTGYIDAPAANSEYSVEFLDERGEVVASYPVDVLVAEEPGIESRRINTLIPVPEVAYNAYRLVRNSETLARRDLPAQQALAAQAQSAANLTVSENTLLLEWGTPQTAAMVRYTVNGGQSWTTLALDHLGGALSVSVSELPEGKIQFQIVSADSIGRSWTLDWEK